MSKKIFIISGYAQTGKDTAAKALVTRGDVVHLSFAERLKDSVNLSMRMLGITDLDLHKEEDKIKYRSLLVEHAKAARSIDSAVFAKALVPRINSALNTDKHVVISDWRYMNEYKVICETFGFDNVITMMIEREDSHPANDEEKNSIAEIKNIALYKQEFRNGETLAISEWAIKAYATWSMHSRA
jgi:hypothetical protein